MKDSQNQRKRLTRQVSACDTSQLSPRTKICFYSFQRTPSSRKQLHSHLFHDIYKQEAESEEEIPEDTKRRQQQWASTIYGG